MCGIAGIYNTDGEPPNHVLLERMARAIAHRGPDGERYHLDSGLGLAHRHLRIIDLSDAAMQPMTNENGSIWLIFNGEIYNYVELRPQLEAAGHVFRSHSDTETVIHAYEQWGEECLHRFNGMFAFALWDAPRKRLFISRDRVGVKPLYYSWDGTSLVFASEIKALLRHPGVLARPNLSAIAGYMSAMYSTGEESWFEGIYRLLPGHYMIISPEGLTLKQWWDLPDVEDALGQHSEGYYVRNARRLLEDSGRIRLRSDVPLGSHLSGGLDSSAIVAILSRQLAPHGERLRTFSGAFAGSVGPEYDERPYIHDVVARYQTEHRETVPTASDLPRLMEQMTWHMDEPAAGPGILLQWAVCDLTRRSGVTVINGGQGGDEAWGGYYGYVPAYLQTLAAQAAKHPALYGDLLRDAVEVLFRRDTRKTALRALASGRRGRYRAMEQVGPWAGDVFGGMDGAERGAAVQFGGAEGRTPLGAAMYYDFKWYLPALLQVEDRTSMAFSLESRAPLLDYRLLELSAAVPSALKLKGLEMKHILKRAAKDLLPQSVYRRTDKKGMPTPIAPWFRGELSGWVERELGSPAARSLFSTLYVREALMDHSSGKVDRSFDIWKMLSVTAWWRLFIDGEMRVPSTKYQIPSGEPQAIATQ
jgi:asparagine synthase (glutamine-hydrolysing)